MPPRPRPVLLPLLLLALACPAATEPEARPVTPVNAEKGLALHGYDPVAYFTDGRAVPGLAEHSLQHAGATWRFATAEHQGLFQADPERFLPRYGGYCAYAMSKGRLADVDPDDFAVVDGHLYLNNNALIHAWWTVGRSERIGAADANWAAWPKAPVQ